ncbi:OmpA/MotB domain protein [Leadbetterella byssophila DSM 17132]|uniref:OmpA/MotB domain protein n=1 Tax=Leadbetterella byssophila (strain DSM 17132 / JCM 16389 / KACC 11308 / NBRC 106382 / 4M15) TaxID=649349 RepID=E4RWP6_LEAB4|nr:OmpA family protein [Leadbetterella byssophila]ADQ16215.1 OmpA/MotB domain protein [Leadbetterella byssophila DSM 17132]
MVKGLIKTFVLLFLTWASFAQEVQWASKVLEKSSETVDEKFSPKHRAIQVLGPPSVLPQTISSACSWRPTGTSFGEDYIKVAFDKPQKVKQIIVGETVGPGAVGRIFGYTTKNKEVLLYESQGDNFRKQPGIWNQFIPETEEEIAALKLVIVHSLNKGIKEYDCIGISSSSEPYVATVNVAQNLPKDLKKENLGPSVNTKYSEVAPLVSPDGKYLYFSRWDHPKNFKPAGSNESTLDVWVSTLAANGTWEPAKNMSTSIHHSAKNGAATIAMDGKSIYALNVEVGRGKFDAGLTKVSLKNNKWVNKRPIKIANFEALSYYNSQDRQLKKETEFSMSSDEKFLVMGLVRKDSYGDKDLYVSFKTGEDSYSKPVNLGPVINTAGNEGSPFLAADNKTLYFNSNGHPGYGDMDIFMSTRLDDTWTNWTEPVNLGPQINSPEFDGYISIPASGEYAYFSSAKNSMGLDDLFKVKLFPSIQPESVVLMEFSFVDEISGQSIEPKVSISPQVEWVWDEETKIFKTIFQPGQTYELKAESSGYPSFSQSLDFREVKEYLEKKEVYKWRKIGQESIAQTAPKTVNAEPESVKDMVIEAGKKIVLREVYFDQSKAELRQESFVELDRIKKIMMEHPDMVILLEGHTDNQGDANLNFKLAEQRILNVKNYLIEDGQIKEERIQLKSWGQYRPLVKNTTEEERRKNRRVEFTILKM